MNTWNRKRMRRHANHSLDARPPTKKHKASCYTKGFRKNVNDNNHNDNNESQTKRSKHVPHQAASNAHQNEATAKSVATKYGEFNKYSAAKFLFQRFEKMQPQKYRNKVSQFFGADAANEFCPKRVVRFLETFDFLNVIHQPNGGHVELITSNIYQPHHDETDCIIETLYDAERKFIAQLTGIQFDEQVIWHTRIAYDARKLFLHGGDAETRVQRIIGLYFAAYRNEIQGTFVHIQQKCESLRSAQDYMKKAGRAYLSEITYFSDLMSATQSMKQFIHNHGIIDALQAELDIYKGKTATLYNECLSSRDRVIDAIKEETTDNQLEPECESVHDFDVQSVNVGNENDENDENETDADIDIEVAIKTESDQELEHEHKDENGGRRIDANDDRVDIDAAMKCWEQEMLWLPFCKGERDRLTLDYSSSRIEPIMQMEQLSRCQQCGSDFTGYMMRPPQCKLQCSAICKQQNGYHHWPAYWTSDATHCIHCYLQSRREKERGDDAVDIAVDDCIPIHYDVLNSRIWFMRRTDDKVQDECIHDIWSTLNNDKKQMVNGCVYRSQQCHNPISGWVNRIKMEWTNPDGDAFTKYLSEYRVSNASFGVVKMEKVMDIAEQLEQISETIRLTTDEKMHKLFGEDIEILEHVSYKDTVWYKKRINYHKEPKTWEDSDATKRGIDASTLPGYHALDKLFKTIISGIEKYTQEVLGSVIQFQRQQYHRLKKSAKRHTLQHHRDLQQVNGGSFVTVTLGQSGTLIFRGARKVGGCKIEIEKEAGDAICVLPFSIASTQFGHAVKNNADRPRLIELEEAQPIREMLQKKPNIVNTSLLARFGCVYGASNGGGKSPKKSSQRARAKTKKTEKTKKTKKRQRTQNKSKKRKRSNDLDGFVVPDDEVEFENIVDVHEDNVFVV